MPNSNYSASSFGSGSSKSLVGKLTKFELKRRFYEKLEDFKYKVLLHKEDGMTVYRARCSYSGAVVVLKGYSRETLNMQTKERVWNEVQALQNSQCPFILKCFDAFEDQGSWWLVLENCAAGDLFSAINLYGAIHEEGWLVTQVMLPLLQTLAYLHNEGIIHRDIKPENLLFNSEKVGKLSGFYLSTDVTRVGYPTDLVGTLDYMAPEVFILNNGDARKDPKVLQMYPNSINNYDSKVDIWQVGVLTFDVLVGHGPFDGDTPEQTVSNILFSEPEYPVWISEEAVDFMSMALQKYPEDRPTAKQLLNHPWVRALLGWEPPDDFESPIAVTDYRYYQRSMGEGSDVEDNDELDGWISNQRQWYNPKTWFNRNTDNAEQDLTGTHPAKGYPPPPPASMGFPFGGDTGHVIHVHGGGAGSGGRGDSREGLLQGGSRQRGEEAGSLFQSWCGWAGALWGGSNTKQQQQEQQQLPAPGTTNGLHGTNRVVPMEEQEGYGASGSKGLPAPRLGKETHVHRISDDFEDPRIQSSLMYGEEGWKQQQGGQPNLGPRAAVPALEINKIKGIMTEEDIMQLESARAAIEQAGTHELHISPSRITRASAAMDIPSPSSPASRDEAPGIAPSTAPGVKGTTGAAAAEAGTTVTKGAAAAVPHPPMHGSPAAAAPGSGRAAAAVVPSMGMRFSDGSEDQDSLVGSIMAFYNTNSPANQAEERLAPDPRITPRSAAAAGSQAPATLAPPRPGPSTPPIAPTPIDIRFTPTPTPPQQQALPGRGGPAGAAAPVAEAAVVAAALPPQMPLPLPPSVPHQGIGRSIITNSAGLVGPRPPAAATPPSARRAPNLALAQPSQGV